MRGLILILLLVLAVGIVLLVPPYVSHRYASSKKKKNCPTCQRSVSVMDAPAAILCSEHRTMKINIEHLEDRVLREEGEE
jgi:uncharacterized protein YneF (UPF0154 family)